MAAKVYRSNKNVQAPDWDGCSLTPVDAPWPHFTAAAAAAQPQRVLLLQGVAALQLLQTVKVA
jgi:hypothetical protein